MGIVLPNVLNLHYVHAEVSVHEVRAFEWPGSHFIGEEGSPLWSSPGVFQDHTPNLNWKEMEELGRERPSWEGSLFLITPHTRGFI